MRFVRASLYGLSSPVCFVCAFTTPSLSLSAGLALALAGLGIGVAAIYELVKE